MSFRLRLTQADVDLLGALERAGLDVTLIGGRAMIFYGMPRETFDTDIVMDLRVGVALGQYSPSPYPAEPWMKGLTASPTR